MTLRPNDEELIDSLIDVMGELIEIESKVRELREGIEPIANRLYYARLDKESH